MAEIFIKSAYFFKEKMEIKIKNLPKSEIEMEVELNADEWEKFLDSAASELSKDLSIEGFRPGRAPRHLVEAKVGAEKFLAAASQLAVEKSYVRAILEKNLEVISRPELHVMKVALNSPFIFKARMAIMPAVKLPDYRKISRGIKRHLAAELAPKPLEIEKAMEDLRKSRAKFTTVSRPARLGDRVEIDFVASSAGHKIDRGESKNHPFVLGEGHFVPGFEEQLPGMKEGEEKQFSLDFPSDFSASDLAGKKVDFSVKMNLVQERELPAADDDFAKNIGQFMSLEDLRESIMDGLLSENEDKEKDRWRLEAVKEIAKQMEAEIPDVLIEGESNKMMQEFKESLQNFGLDFAVYLAQLKKSEDELKKDWRDKAEDRVKAALALREIAKKEEIEPTAEEIEAEMNNVLKRYPSVEETKKQVDIDYLRDYTGGMLKNEKVFQLLENQVEN